jgi:hypothetical protein
MKETKISITLSGVTPILFDRYLGNNTEQARPMDKVYVDQDGIIGIPAINILSFLSAQNTESAPQRVSGRGWKRVAKAAQSYVQIDPLFIPFKRDGKTLTKETADLKIHFAIARVMKGKLSIPNPKERPMLETPWEIKFNVCLLETPDLNELLLQKLFEIGGIAIGLGTFRGVFGKFKVAEWKTN